MPIHDDFLQGDVPEGAHLALLTGPGEAIGIPIGARMVLVFDPERPDRVHPVFLAKMTRETLVFRCNCGQPTCTAVFHYKLTLKGNHPVPK